MVGTNGTANVVSMVWRHARNSVTLWMIFTMYFREPEEVHGSFYGAPDASRRGRSQRAAAGQRDAGVFEDAARSERWFRSPHRRTRAGPDQSGEGREEWPLRGRGPARFRSPATPASIRRRRAPSPDLPPR